MRHWCFFYVSSCLEQENCLGGETNEGSEDAEGYDLASGVVEGCVRWDLRLPGSAM